jgi:nitrite reductase/ring-hydroxylating ferredoxin subunit
VSAETRSAAEVVVGRVEDLPPGSVKIVPVGPFGVGVFNVNGEFHALNNYCPHRGGPMCLGETTGTTRSPEYGALEWIADGEILKCPWHGWEFSIPTGCSLTAPVKKVKKYGVTVEDGVVMLQLRSREAGTSSS